MNNQKLVFGLKGLKANTPPELKAAYRVMMAIVGIWAIIQPAFPEIPATAVSVVDRLCLIGGPVFYYICQMVGYAEEETSE